ncbi:MAG TPA: DUF2075 domain-containing protein [Verrucomicrobiae bacterium]|jgi:hypothetical protein|nr:DUF2075 domain-containing protein [Verrucomicrobiae bacterium]
MPVRTYYHAPISSFLQDDAERILGVLASQHHHALEESQRWAWLQQIAILKSSLVNQTAGRIFLEFFIPRMGKRADAIVVAKNIVFVIEFKTGANSYTSAAFQQVEDYALDLKNFHEGSHDAPIIPLLVSTDAESKEMSKLAFADDLVALPIGANSTNLGPLIDGLCVGQSFPDIDIAKWMAKGYRPTPTIVQAAEVLYRTHSVLDIARSDASAQNLQETNSSVNAVINRARANHIKAICFVTGVPGSGKTLAGLNIATQRSVEHLDEHAVFLSGNGPLVDVLREALTRDKAKRESIPKKRAEREVRSFIQNIHHFRDEYVGNTTIPLEKVAVFDEAQRAWTRKQAAKFMRQKRGLSDFDMSEPEFLISVMDRHSNWCTIVCLIGGGQEIHTGEAGISEWINALEGRFPKWEIHASSRMLLPEYGAAGLVERFAKSPRVYSDEYLHLAVSMRSFRAEALSEVVGHIVDNEPKAASAAYKKIASTYPIFLTRNLSIAKAWLRSRARGTERFGLVASSGALRLRAEGIHIKAELEPANWFLNDSSDVRSSNYLEDVASEFAVQGLELDWVGVCWDGDFQHKDDGWIYKAFKGTKWQSISDESRRKYLKNAYRVILTRARQGMVLFVPLGEPSDHTRLPSFYDETFAFLHSCGIPSLD